MLLVVAIVAGAPSAGCTTNRAHDEIRVAATSRVLVVAPVVNLSGSQDFDALKVTDILASEFLTYPGVAVIPVNLTLGALARHGKTRVETPAEARALAREFGADATIVAAITEYDPYDPPIVGLILQWYSVVPDAADQMSRAATDDSRATAAPMPVAAVGPELQVQRVFNAARNDVVSDLRRFAAKRDHDKSPYGWKRYLKSQELYVRYCCGAAIRTILGQSVNHPDVAEVAETES